MRRGEAGERVACRGARLNVNVTDGAAAGLTRIYDREPSVSSGGIGEGTGEEAGETSSIRSRCYVRGSARCGIVKRREKHESASFDRMKLGWEPT